jgi:hypothetical protein
MVHAKPFPDRNLHIATPFDPRCPAPPRTKVQITLLKIQCNDFVSCVFVNFSFYSLHYFIVFITLVKVLFFHPSPTSFLHIMLYYIDLV